MVRLAITDNRRKGRVDNGKSINECLVEPEQLTEEECQSVIDGLVSVSDTDIREMPNLLVFPHTFVSEEKKNKDDEDNEKLYICKYVNDKIYTGNLMGFVSVTSGDGENKHTTQISIRSRFAKDGEEDYFLHYMIMKVFCPNIVNLSHQISRESVFDFLLYMFPKFFNEALSQGVYKEYRRFEYNDSKVKGTIDVSRHIRYNIPFNGRIAYSTREYSTDNRITQLVRHTIEFIKASPLGRGILSDKTTQDNIRLVTDCTKSYSKGDRNKIISDNIREVRHPYFTKYTALQKLCVSILRHEELKYGNSNDEIHGILFDGAWLWEEYLNVVFKPLDLKHAENKTGKHGYSLFGNETYMRYPDFYKENEIVIDAKYKRLDSGNIDRNDMHQIITYLHTLYAKGAYLAYPIEDKEIEAKEGEKEKRVKTIGTLKGQGGKIGLVGLKIPQECESLEGFVNEIAKEEIKMREQIKEIKILN